jgi:D-alanyl-D-alanine carboxypeptidase (penicillin-binding protein 5/6)
MSLNIHAFSRPHGPRRRRAGIAGTLLLAALALLGARLLGPAPLWAANQSVQGAQPKKEEGGLDLDAPMAILIEAKSGSVLFEKNADQAAPPSSMLKLMTAEFVFSLLKKGEVKPTDQYVISENTWRRGGAPAGGPTMFAAIHSRVSVDDLLRGLIIDNANDAAMALAEGIAGSEREFAAMLTKRARDIGLAQTSFANATGMTDAGNRMTARDIARLARHIILTYPDYYKLYNEREFTWNKIRQQNRNPLLNAFTAADGLNAGSTKEGGYGLAGSAVQDGQRLIVVVNGLDDPDDRIAEGKKLLEFGFRNFEIRNLFTADQVIGRAKVFGGDSGSVGVAPKGPVGMMVQRNGSDKLVARIVYQGPLRAPLEAGQQVGVVRVWRGQNLAVEAPLFTTEPVGVGSTMRRAIDGVSELVIGLFRSGTAKL